MRQYVIRHALGLSILLMLPGHAVRAYETPFIHSLDNLIYDTKIKPTMPQTMDERVVVFDIDEKSRSEIGSWPWGRDRMATLVDKLFERYRIGIMNGATKFDTK